MADTTVPKALEGLAISKTKELKGTEKRDTLIEIEKVCLAPSDCDLPPL
jgi:leucyl-tRNA synthetase